MNTFTEALLTTINTVLQWMAIAGTGLGLLSAIGLFFVTGELSDRQEKRLATAQQDALKANTETQNLKAKLQPRSISDAQKQIFLQSIKGAQTGKVSVFSYMSADPGTIQYANQIRELVVAAGFDAGIMVGMNMGGAVPTGAAIAIKNPQSPPAFAGHLQQAFAAAAIPLSPLIIDSLQPNEVQVLIGLKPDQ